MKNNSPFCQVTTSSLLLLVRPFSLKDGRSSKIISIQQFSKLTFCWLHFQDMSKIMGLSTNSLKLVGSTLINVEFVVGRMCYVKFKDIEPDF